MSISNYMYMAYLEISKFTSTEVSQSGVASFISPTRVFGEALLYWLKIFHFGFSVLETSGGNSSVLTHFIGSAIRLIVTTLHLHYICRDVCLSRHMFSKLVRTLLPSPGPHPCQMHYKKGTKARRTSTFHFTLPSHHPIFLLTKIPDYLLR